MASKRGQFKRVDSEGNKGLPPISGVSKPNVSKGKPIDFPGEKGNRGILVGKASKGSKVLD